MERVRIEFFPTEAARPPNVVLVSSVVFTAESRSAAEGGPLGKFPASIDKFRSLLAGSVVYVHTPVPDHHPARDTNNSCQLFGKRGFYY